MPEPKSADGSTRGARSVGLCLSGGGSRAIAFHLGVLSALHELGIDRQVEVVSTVSGGSVVGALWALYGHDWSRFVGAANAVLSAGIESRIAYRLLVPRRGLPLRWAAVGVARLGVPVGALADALVDAGVPACNLSELPDRPALILNATDLRTGKGFKFSRRQMGTHVTGPVDASRFSLPTAVACSAGYPIHIAPYRMSLQGPNMHGRSESLWIADGGVYDNLGANALLPDKRPEISFMRFQCSHLLIADASRPYSPHPEGRVRLFPRLIASVETSSERVRALTHRHVFALQEAGNIRGVLDVKMDSRHPEANAEWTEADVLAVRRVGTHFRRLVGGVRELVESRGYTMTRTLVPKYVSELMDTRGAGSG